MGAQGAEPAWGWAPRARSRPAPGRLFAVYDAFAAGYEVDEVFRLSGIDPDDLPDRLLGPVARHLFLL